MKYSVLCLALCFGCLGVAPVWAQQSPPIQEVQRRALLYAGLDGLDVHRWKQRVKWQAALPQLRFSVQRDLDEQLKITNKDNISISSGDIIIGPDKQDVVRDFDAGTRFQVTAVWYLDRLVFNRDTIVVSQERRRRHDERLQLLDRVTKHYYEREAALETLRTRRLSTKDRLKLKILVKDRTARLDAATGGWFSETLRKGGSQ